MTEQQNKNRIDFLDFMRVFAFISVLVGHKQIHRLVEFAADPANHATLRSAADIAIALCNGGGAGVVVFFLTSGYIITHVLKTEAPVDFLIKRFFRIYPLYAFAVVTELAVGAIFYDTKIPDASVLIPRLLLIGDFFTTPYGLGSVEWTLRIEVMFYVFMAALKGAGLLSRPALLPGLFVAVTISTTFLNPFPSGYGWSDGYLFIFGPYLFIGSIIYLIEHGSTRKASGAFSIAALCFVSLHLFGAIQPNWNASHFPALGVGVFFLAWVFRDKFHTGSIARILSDLTFSVYLFHNWLWGPIYESLRDMHIVALPHPFPTVMVLFALCYLTHRCIERPAIQIGRRVLRRYHRRKSASTLALEPN